MSFFTGLFVTVAMPFIDMIITMKNNVTKIPTTATVIEIINNPVSTVVFCSATSLLNSELNLLLISVISSADRKVGASTVQKSIILQNVKPS